MSEAVGWVVGIVAILVWLVAICFGVAMVKECRSWVAKLGGVLIVIAMIGLFIAFMSWSATRARHQIEECLRRGGTPITSGHYYAHLDECVIVVRSKP